MLGRLRSNECAGYVRTCCWVMLYAISARPGTLCVSVVKWDRGPGHKYGLRQHAGCDQKWITWARCEFYGDMFARCFDGAVKRQISFWGRIRRTCCQPGLKTEARLEKVTADVCDSVWKKWQESIFRSFVNVWLLQKVTSEDWGQECYLSWSLFVSASLSTAKRQILRWSHETCTLTGPDLREKKRRSHVFIWIRLPNDQFVRFNESFLYWTKNEVLHQTPTALRHV